jgi:hypothetical protein
MLPKTSTVLVPILALVVEPNLTSQKSEGGDGETGKTKNDSSGALTGRRRVCQQRRRQHQPEDAQVLVTTAGGI